MCKRGELTVITGTMFAGKTDELIRKITRWRKYFNKKVVVFKPTTDTRSPEGFIKTADGQKMDAYEIDVKRPKKILKILKKKSGVDEVVVDEAQFFPPKGKFVRVIDEACKQGYRVTVAGLDLDFRREPFETTSRLLALADNITKLEPPSCARCKKQARFPQRLIKGKPAHYKSPLFKVGGKEMYEARCYRCHKLPGKPAL